MNRRAPLIAALIALVLAVAVFFLLVLPAYRNINETQDELTAAEEQEQVLSLELARLQDVQEKAPQLRKQLARLRKSVPPVADLPGMINQVQNAANVANVDFFSISPGEPLLDPTGQAAVIPTQIQVIGGFFQVDEFLFRLEELKRGNKSISIDVSEGPEQLPQLQVTLSVEFWTSDATAGPGGGPASTAAAPPPAPEQSPGASPSPSPSPAEGA